MEITTLHCNPMASSMNLSRKTIKLHSSKYTIKVHKALEYDERESEEGEFVLTEEISVLNDCSGISICHYI